MSHSILVFCEQKKDKLCVGAYELMRKARKAAEETGLRLVAVVLGEDCNESAKQVSKLGAERVLYETAEVFDGLNAKPYIQALCHIADAEDAGYIFVDGSALGTEIATGTAIQRDMAFSGICESVVFDEGKPETRISVENRSILACHTITTEKPCVILFSQVLLRGIAADTFDEAEIIPFHVSVDNGKFIPEEQETLAGNEPLSDAQIIIAGGRGLGSKEAFDKLYELADLLGASVGASRAAVYHEWADEAQMVGLSGTSVSPKLYISCGISGAMQHLEGMENADYVLSINSNPTAPVTQVADLSIVGDARDFVPKLIAAVRERVGA
ncbi:MAG: electron transfer flavoprotein subunit alpha/FixB family protein [Lachnospiraceae bacterium]|nr:electron transfer flavoprotein subunit alpha/FixB family protein [Lachnospiraceae bacterium]